MTNNTPEKNKPSTPEKEFSEKLTFRDYLIATEKNKPSTPEKEFSEKLTVS